MLTSAPSNDSFILSKSPTGIAGFDEMTQGGLPQNRSTLLMGNPGCGKTVFALQMLVNGARQHNEPGIFISFEESPQQILTNTASFGWNLPELVERKQLLIIDARLSPSIIQTGQFDLSGILATLEAQVKALGARRIVFDAIEVLLTLLNDPAAERHELYRLHSWLGQQQLTGVLTIGAESNEPPLVRRYDFLPFMVDCIIQLQHRLIERVSLRELRILKYRGSSYTANQVPLTISSTGIEVASLGTTELDYPVFTERISSGVARLDTMLRGGYYRGTSVLITGAPGTAKTTLAAAFAQAACQRGERTLFISFDEAAQEIVRNVASVSIDLQQHLDRGLLQMYAGRTEAQSAEDHLIVLRELMRRHRPRCLVVDPISALVKSGGELTALGVAQRLMRWAKLDGITTLCTSLLEGHETNLEGSAIHISTIADTWVHLSYVVQAGERNRALTIVKARGTRHSNQVRELLLSDSGITLRDVYTAGGEVLLGTLRWEKELSRRVQQQQRRLELAAQQRALADQEARITAQIAALQRELENQRASFSALQQAHTFQEEQWEEEQQMLRELRGADFSEHNGPASAADGSPASGHERAEV